MQIRSVALHALFLNALVLSAAVTPPALAAAQEPSGPVGAWQGALEIGAIKLRLALHLQIDANGKWSATLDSIDQGAKGIPLDDAAFADGALTVSSDAMKMKYEARLDPSGKRLDGTFTQAGQSFPLALERVEKIAELVRPQTPRPPFPYREEAVTFPSLAEGVSLAGTITLPGASAGGPHPVVVLISGSGAQDRDETLLGHKPFWVLADYLARRGIAVLRYDDRGTGQSTGDFAQADSRDFTDDALGAVAFLKSRADVASDRIGLAGHSEGGLIAPLAAVKSRDVRFIVLMAGPGLTGEQILITQGRDILKAMGAPDESLDRQERFQRNVFRAMAEESDLAKAKEKLNSLMADEIAALPADQRPQAEEQLRNGQAQLDGILTPWFRFFLSHDPAPTLRRVACPVLAINGEKDLQVAAKVNLQAIERALAEGGNRDFKTIELAGLNHLFQTATTGAPNEYGTIEETFNESALSTIGDWVVAHTSPSAAKRGAASPRARPSQRCNRARPLQRLFRRR